MINSVNSTPSAHWLNHLPDEWGITRLANVADILFSNVDKHTIEGEFPVKLCNYVDVYKNDRITNDIEFMDASADAREIERFQILAGDVLATKDSETPDDIAISALVTESLPGVLCGYHLALIRPRKHLVYGPYIAWLHGCKLFRSHYEANAVGVTRFGLSQAAFREARIPLPSLAEQKCIASFLDKTGAAIDTAIEKKQKQLETLDALRKSIIHKAVTRGLDDSVDLKDSGVEWIGHIPKHWQPFRLKDVAGVNGRALPSMTDADCVLRYLEISNVNNRGIVSEDAIEEIAFIDAPSRARRIVLTGDTLISSVRPNLQAVAHIVNVTDNLIASTGFYVVSPNHRRLDPKYTYYFLLSENTKQYLEAVAKGVGYPAVDDKDFTTLKCFLPPIPEQRQIVDYLDRKIAVLYDLQKNLSGQISTLEQYRKSLIHECVTGKRRITDKGGKAK